MLICRVVGSAVSTVKDEKLKGLKLLIVREVTVRNRLVGKPLVAVDSVGAGEGELVFVAQGSSARQTHLTQSAPVDATIMAIADSLEVGGKVTYRKA